MTLLESSVRPHKLRAWSRKNASILLQMPARSPPVTCACDRVAINLRFSQLPIQVWLLYARDAGRTQENTYIYQFIKEYSKEYNWTARWRDNTGWGLGGSPVQKPLSLCSSRVWYVDVFTNLKLLWTPYCWDFYGSFLMWV